MSLEFRREFIMIEGKPTEISYDIHNSKGEWLGNIVKKRVGRFMHWCFEPRPDTYFTNGCMKDISKQITAAYSENKNVQ